MNKSKQKWLVLLYTLSEMGGGGPRNAVLQHINDYGYWDKNDANDILRSTRNEKAWRNDFSFERQHLVEQGLMEGGGDGNWKITESGRAYLSQLKDLALHLGAGTVPHYTPAFFQELVAPQSMMESAEDQILITQLAQREYGKETDAALLSDTPQEKGAVSRKSANGTVYLRRSAVARCALDRAENLCEIDPTHKSFLRRDGVSLYMEPHHLIPMSLTDFFGVNLDRTQNIFSLCSHCHNQIHYGTKEDVRRLVSKLFLVRKNEICSILGRTIELEDLYRIYKAL